MKCTDGETEAQNKGTSSAWSPPCTHRAILSSMRSLGVYKQKCPQTFILMVLSLCKSFTITAVRFAWVRDSLPKCLGVHRGSQPLTQPGLFSPHIAVRHS